MTTLRAIWRLIKLAAFVICCLYHVAFTLPKLTPEARGRMIREWSAKFGRWMEIKISHEGDVEDKEAFDTGITKGKLGRLFVSNHMTFLDPLMIDAVLPSGFVAKVEIASWPLLGRICSAVGTIYIERGNKRALLGIADNMGAALNEGRSVLMFPEGTTSDGTGLLKLHSNLFEAAARTGATVIPLVLRYRVNGVDTTRASWVGHEPLFNCLWRIVTTDNLELVVKILKPIQGDERHELCRKASAQMCQAIGCKDLLAEG